MKYLPLFHIEITHGYYTDSRCCDFDIQPDRKGEEVIRRHRLKMTHFANGVSVSAPVENGALVVDVSEAVFSFQLILRNRQFFHITNLILNEGLRVYQNKANSTVLQPVTGKPEDKQNAFGIIRLSAIRFLKEAPTYTLHFEPKKAVWKYIVVTRDGSVAEYAIEQRGTPDTEKKTVFVQSNSNVNPVLLKLLDNDYPQAKKITIVSKEPIAYLQTGRKNIQLLKNNEVVVDHLPNPLPDEDGIKVIKYLKN